MHSTKTVVLIGCTLVLVTLVYNIYISSIKGGVNAPIAQMDIVNLPHQSISVNHLEHRSPTLEYLTENEALRFSPCPDYKTAADANMSVVSVKDNNKATYNIGDEIKVFVTLYNGYGAMKKSGGDQLRVRMFRNTIKAYASGYIIDHNNGTYTAILEALWAGESSITITLAHTREEASSIYRVRTQIPCTQQILAQFKSDKVTEETICHPVPEKLKQYTKLCNLTYVNSGMPWYCGKPTNIQLLCEDWTYTKKKDPKLPFNTHESLLIERNRKEREIPGLIKVKVRNKIDSEDALVRTSGIPCYKYNFTNLWSRQTPINGFLYNGTWHFKHCKAPSISIKSCLRNITLLLFGDSTVRAWYLDIVRRFDCTQLTQKWTQEKWHKRAACSNANLSFVTEFLIHSQPFYLGFNWETNHYTTYSIARHLEEVGDNEHVVVVIHVYLHLVAYHHDVFRTRMKIIRNSVENLLKRNPFAKILIKGPHTCTRPAIKLRLTDYYAYIYRDILFEVFEGLHDQVVYLDYIGIANAIPVEDPHPPKDIVSDMVDMMLAYVCK